jgi:superoxide reductase
MEEKHSILWIELCAGEERFQASLKPDGPPAAEFKTGAAKVTARAYCNLHGLWQSEG